MTTALLPFRPLTRWLAVLGVFLAALLLLLSGCSMSVDKSEQGKQKKVKIETLLGSLHVNTDADPRDTGLEVYPGAQRVEKHGSEEGSANVNIESSMFGVKVVAIEYHSDDPPDQLLGFYRKQLKPFGEVAECHGSTNFHEGKVQCRPGTGRPNETQLVVGTENRHRLVAVRPEGKGTNFALVYVQTRGERGTL